MSARLVALLLLAATPAFAADAGEEAQQLPFRWEVQNLVEEIDIPDVIMADGIPVKLKQVVVKGKLEDVMRGFVDSFLRQKLYVQPPDQQQVLSAHAQLTGLDTDRFISYSVLAQQASPELCSVVLGEANVGLGVALKSANADAQNFAPLFPGATDVVRTQSEGMRSITFAAPGTVAEVKAFYDEVLGKAGYKQSKPGRFRKNQEELNVVVASQKGVTSVLLSSRPLPASDGL